MPEETAPPEPTRDQKRNGWTAKALKEYNDTIEQNIQARHFGGIYADADVHEDMKRRNRAKAIKCENVASYEPLDW